MDLHLYNRSGGRPMHTAVIEITNTVGGTYTQTTLVSGVACKRVIPVWLVLNSYDAGDRYFFRLRSGSTNLALNITLSYLAFPSCLVFDEGLHGKVGVGDDINIAYKGDTGDNGTHGTITCGYYLI